MLEAILYIVLILVLVEDTLRDIDDLQIYSAFVVLILVLVEDTLRAFVKRC